MGTVGPTFRKTLTVFESAAAHQREKKEAVQSKIASLQSLGQCQRHKKSLFQTQREKEREGERSACWEAEALCCIFNNLVIKLKFSIVFDRFAKLIQHKHDEMRFKAPAEIVQRIRSHREMKASAGCKNGSQNWNVSEILTKIIPKHQIIEQALDLKGTEWKEERGERKKRRRRRRSLR